MLKIEDVIKIDIPYYRQDIYVISQISQHFDQIPYIGTYEFNIYGNTNICSNNMSNPCNITMYKTQQIYTKKYLYINHKRR